MPKHTILVEVSQNSQNGPADGPGPIYTCRRLVYSYRRDAAGNFRADFPATDTRLALLTIKNTILRFYVGGELVFSGIVERIKRVMDRKGKQTVIVTGRDDVLGMLAENIVGDLALSFAYDAPSQILGASNVTNRTLTLSGDGYSTTTYSYTKQFAGESALQALIKVAEDTGEHFRGATGGTTELIWMRTDTPAAPIRLVASGGPLLHENPDVAIIEDIESDQNGEKLFNRVYPYGAGNGAARLTLEHSTTTMPAGFSMNTAGNYIQYDDGQNLPSVQRSIRKLFNHIGIENSDTYSINVTTTATTGATLISVEAIALPIASGTLLDLNGGGVNFVELSANVSPGANVLNVVATGFDVLDTDTLVYTNPVAQEGAARQLTDAALAFLRRICDPDNLVSYKMTVRGLPDSIHVGMLIPVLSQAPGFEIDDDLIILEITRTVDRNGRTPAILTVVPVDWFDMGEAASVATAIEELRNYQSQTQPVDFSSVTNPPTIPADFLDLGDVPAAYTGAGGQFVKVNVGETALEFAAGTGDVAGETVAAAAKTTPVDADLIPLVDSAAANVLKQLSWANVKATLKTYFDTLYNLYVHPNHTGDVTSVGDGATTIAADAVTNAKAANMAESTVKGRAAAAGTGDPTDLTATQVRTIINVASGADVTGTAITALATKATPVDADAVVITDSAASDAPKRTTWANIKATLQTYLDTLYVGLTGDQVVAGIKRFSSSLRTGSSSTIYLEQAQAGVTITDTSWTTVLSGLTGVSLVYFQLNSNATNYGGVFYVINNGGTITITPIQVTNMVAGEPGAGFNVGYQASGTALQMKAGASWPATIGCNIAASRLVW